MTEAATLHTFGPNREFVEALTRDGVKFLVVGGLAVKHYCPDREVDDLDLLIDPTIENAEKVLRVLRQFHLSPDFAAADLAGPKKQVPLKHFLYVDLLTPPDGVAFAELWSQSTQARLGTAAVRVASIEDLLKMKGAGAAEGREKDAQDIGKLEAVAV